MLVEYLTLQVLQSKIEYLKAFLPVATCTTIRLLLKNYFLIEYQIVSSFPCVHAHPTQLNSTFPI
uniref:Uncharacterized protein n=1 Tax=Rhizophora mucronata TaxID=61149 RepID=A0A2P2NEZ3_RHIMU